MATAKNDVSGLTDEQRHEISDAAAEWLNAGCCVHPSRIDRPDKLKQPLNVEGAGKTEGSWGWHKIAHELMPGFTLEEIREEILSGRHDGFGIFTGKVSGGLEMLELEGRVIDRLEELVERARVMGTGKLLDRVTNRGFVERSPSGGQHILYRVTGGDVPGSVARPVREVGKARAR
jgi:putative DNA primase/helicase